MTAEHHTLHVPYTADQVDQFAAATSLGRVAAGVKLKQLADAGITVMFPDRIERWLRALARDIEGEEWPERLFTQSVVVKALRDAAEELERLRVTP